MSSRTRISQISTFGVLLALLVTPIWSFAGMMDVPFHPDESVYIYMARYFDLYFLKRDFSNPEWDTKVIWSVTQPPVSKYLIGLALFATGHDFSALHHPWDWGLDEEANFERGNVPSASALFVSRSLMTCLFTLSIVLCAAIGYRLSGFVGAFVAGPVFATSGLALQFLRRATADAPLVFFGMLAVVSSMKLLDCLPTSKVKAHRWTYTWAALTGLWLGLAGGSKPSGASLIPMVLLAPAVAWLVGKSGGTGSVPERRLLSLYAILLTATGVSFIVPNPMLYKNPLEGTDALIAHRQAAASIQQQESPEQALTTVPGRARAMLDRVFHPVGLVVFLVGLGLVAGQEFRHWTRGAVSGRTVVLLWVGGTLAFTALFTPMNWGRYFVPLVPCQAVILGYLATAVVGVMRKRRNASYWRPRDIRAYDGEEQFPRLRIEPVSPLARQGGGPDNPRRHTHRDMLDQNRLLVVIPAHNEGDTVGAVIARVRTHVPSADILVIDDGSIDNTDTVAREADALVISLPQKLGIGTATQTGYIFAREMGYNVVARVDADGQHDPAEIPRLISALSEGGAHVVVGSRFVEGGEHATSLVRWLGIRILATLISLITDQKVTDPTSGYQVVDRDALALYANHYAHDYPEPESRVLLHRAGFKVKEIPVSIGRRLGGRSSIGALDSIHYMVRVTIALLIDLLRAAPQGRKRHGEG